MAACRVNVGGENRLAGRESENGKNVLRIGALGADDVDRTDAEAGIGHDGVERAPRRVACARDVATGDQRTHKSDAQNPRRRMTSGKTGTQALPRTREHMLAPPTFAGGRRVSENRRRYPGPR